jgi:hypothetical protein
LFKYLGKYQHGDSAIFQIMFGHKEAQKTDCCAKRANTFPLSQAIQKETQLIQDTDFPGFVKAVVIMFPA